MFGSVLLRRKGVRGFGFGIGCSGVIQMTRDGRRQVGIGRIGVGTVTVMTTAVITVDLLVSQFSHLAIYWTRLCIEMTILSTIFMVPSRRE